MSKYTAEMAHAAVAKGAAWLDTRCPEWFREIKVERLNLDSPTFCVLGQTARCLLGEKPNGRALRGGYDIVLETLGIRDKSAVDMGFNLPLDWDLPVQKIDARYEMLTIAWQEYIRERLAAAEVPA